MTLFDSHIGHLRHAATAITLALAAFSSSAQSVTDVAFQNGLTLSGGALDLSSGSAIDRRLGYFSDIYYDANRNEWWGLSDRGPGGGLLSYETRVQRFTIDIGASGQISNFQVAETVKFTQNSQPLNGQAPNPSNVLGRSFDPEGFVVNPTNGHLLVSDEYGPSVYEFDRSGQFIRAFNTPANLIPRDSVTGTPNYAANPTTNPAGRATNRGFEGLAISPDGKFAYAVLQSPMLDELGPGGNAVYNRIVKFDTTTGNAVGQYAYAMDTASQGRGVSALVALGNDKFMVLERNNRGIGVGATLATADKNVYLIDLAGATDVSAINLTGGTPFTPVAKGAKVIDLDANTQAALGNKSPEKWEGLAIGPRLPNGSFLILAGTDNDYSVTQSGSGTQYDVYFRFTDADPYASSIECPIGSTTGCFLTSNNASAATLTSDYSLLPGVLQSYTANIAGYVAPVPESGTLALLLGGLALVGAAASRRTAGSGIAAG